MMALNFHCSGVAQPKLFKLLENYSAMQLASIVGFFKIGIFKTSFFEKNLFRTCVLILLSTAIVMAAFDDRGLAASDDPFAVLRGKWGGTGTMLLQDGSKDRLVCKAQYTGSSSQLRLAINCKSSSNRIDMKARLSVNGGRLQGVWEEETFKALGTISGTIGENKISFRIAGNVFGVMVVRYSKKRQNISIKTHGVALKDVSIKLGRR
jgi:hypothetical protein